MLRSCVLVIAMVGCAQPLPQEGALEGPGFDPQTGAFVGEGDDFVVVVTHLQVRNAPGPGGRFGDHADAIGTHLFEDEPAGWLGAAFRNVGRLDWWTLTVWTDETSMLQFVVSEPHGAAMADFADITVGGETRSFEVGREALPITWEDALQGLHDDPDVVRGDTRWYASEEP